MVLYRNHFCFVCNGGIHWAVIILIWELIWSTQRYVALMTLYRRPFFLWEETLQLLYSQLKRRFEVHNECPQLKIFLCRLERIGLTSLRKHENHRLKTWTSLQKRGGCGVDASMKQTMSIPSANPKTKTRLSQTAKRTGFKFWSITMNMLPVAFHNTNMLAYVLKLVGRMRTESQTESTTQMRHTELEVLIKS